MKLQDRPRLKIIENDKEYDEALEIINSLMGSGVSEENEDYLEVLSFIYLENSFKFFIDQGFSPLLFASIFK
jgi:hypothetical protein